MDTPAYLLIKTHSGLEDVLENELAELGIPVKEKGFRCVFIPYEHEYIYRANMFLRTALRVLVPVGEFHAISTDDIYLHSLKMRWEDYFSPDKTFAIDFSGRSEVFTHLKFASLRLKDAICDRFRNKFGSRPSVDRENPDIYINLHLHDDKISISIDSSGDSLHIRGSRLAQNQAPLNEVLAAGLIRLTGWDAKSEFVDGMCGSGTFSSEAIAIATQTAPCLLRSQYAFQNLPDFNRDLYENLMDEARKRVVPINFPVRANDISTANTNKARRNLRALGYADNVRFTSLDFSDMEPLGESGVILLNPPYGERMEVTEITRLYGEIGTALKHKWPGFKCGLISSSREGLNAVGLRQRINRTVFNGPLECKFRVYEMYAGSKRGPAED